MSQPRYSLTIAISVPDADGGLTPYDEEVVLDLTEKEARSTFAYQLGVWRVMGGTLRQGDGWATLVTPEVTGRMTVDLVFEEDQEAAEAQADADYDAHVNR